jgi:hypothetical protein
MLVGCGCLCADLPPVGSSESGTSASQSFSTSTPPENQVSCNICAGGVAPLSWDVYFSYGGATNGDASLYPCLPFYANRVKPWRCVSIGQCQSDIPGQVGFCRWRSPEKSKSIRLSNNVITGCMDEPVLPGMDYGPWHQVYIFMGPPNSYAPTGCLPSRWDLFNPIKTGITVLIRYGGEYDVIKNKQYGGGGALYVLPYLAEWPPNCLGPITLVKKQFADSTPWGQPVGGNASPSGFGGAGFTPDPNLPDTVTLKPGPR